MGRFLDVKIYAKPYFEALLRILIARSIATKQSIEIIKRGKYKAV
jgi:hypothetical protein